MEKFHRIVTGQTVTRIELSIAAIIVIIWIGMDVHQYIGFLFEKSCN